jgi:hypothetical protein
MDDRVDDALRDLVRVRKRLCPEQGRIARRNARRGFLGAMKALRNALNATYPREQKKQHEERYVVEVFEPVARVGKRLYHDRWRALQPLEGVRVGKINYTSSIPKRFLTMPRNKLKTAIQFSGWCRKAFPQHTFRLRKVGTTNTIAADVL